MLGRFIDLEKETIRLLIKGEEVPDVMLKTIGDCLFHEKAKKWFKENPVAKEIGGSLLRLYTPHQAQGLYEMYCLKTEAERTKILELMKEKERDLIHAQ